MENILIVYIPKSIFYSDFVDKFFRTACSSLLYKDFNEKAMELLNRMKEQGAQFLRCRKTFSNFGRNCDEILSELHV